MTEEEQKKEFEEWCRHKFLSAPHCLDCPLIKDGRGDCFRKWKERKDNDEEL